MKKLTDYQALIVDMDGTLYYQRPVRISMAAEMLLHFWRARDFLVVSKYRKLYEEGLSEADRLSKLPSNAEKIVHEWMITRPLKYLTKHKDSGLISILESVKRSGVPIIVCSDYPVSDKLAAIGLKPDYAYSAEKLKCMKPDATGISRVLSSLGVLPEKCLVIGDRREKDGVWAENLHAAYLHLPKSAADRQKIYTEITL